MIISRVSVTYLTTSDQPTKIWSKRKMSRAVDVYWIFRHSELQNVAYCEMIPYIYVRVHVYNKVLIYN